MTITGTTSLGKDEIDRMVRDADEHVAEDKRRREEAEIRNNADTLVYQTEKLLAEQGEKLSGPEKDKVTEALNELKHSLDGSDMAAIKTATDALMAASQSFTERLYQEASQQAASQQEGAGSAADENDVVDAEIVDEPKE